MFAWLVNQIKSLILTLWNSIAGWGLAIVSTVLESLDSLIPGINTESVQGVLANINYIFPLYETVSMASVLFTLWGTVLIYRIIKSWVPTVSGA